ncbi:MAG: LysR family transcriptional regulator [Verrucomicrobiae bacterium]|nr:LysR family transcriptional regulator [Verrucomicrobiae bacterium]
MSDTIDSRHILAFVTLATTNNFTKAAATLNLTQSAISRAIAGLESDVGCRLFERAGKKVFLTQAGEQLLPAAQRILSQMSDARVQLRQLGRWGSGRLRVSAGLTACQHLLPPVLREFKESFPRCQITIETGDTEEAVDLLEANRVDLALGMQPSGHLPLTFRPLFEDELFFMVSPLHPWAKAGRVPADEVGRENIILYSKKSQTFRVIEKHFAAQSIVLRSFIEMGSYEAIKEMVKLGLGVSLMTDWVARRELEEGSLIALPLGRRKLRRSWGLFHLKGRRLSLSEETFVGLCKSAFG